MTIHRLTNSLWRPTGSYLLNLSIGRLDPITCAAVVNDDQAMQVVPERRPGETLMQLLARIDATFGPALSDNKHVDEINRQRPDVKVPLPHAYDATIGGYCPLKTALTNA